jgi:hypothetical protein
MKDFSQKHPGFISVLLFIIPVYYFIVSSYYHEQYQVYSVRSQDPEYIYYICAVSIANGKMEVGNIDHPGTTLQYFMAATFRITHMFRAHNAPFNADILSHPDLYLKVFNTVMNVFIMLVLLIAGFLVLKYSGNIWYAFVIQFSPFATEIIYGNIGRITPETIMPVFSVILTLIIFKILIEKESPSSYKTLLSFAAVFVLILALKLTLGFLLILPLFIIKPWKNKVLFLAATAVIFLIFAIPVTLQLDYFWRWIKNLLLHSGQYGQGEKNVLVVSQLWPNIVGLYEVNRAFFHFTLIFVLAFAGTWFFRRKETTKIQNSIALGTFIMVFIQTLALGKQFKTTYFIPALLLLPLMVILTILYLKVWLPEKFRKFLAPVYILLVFALFFKEQRPSFLNLSVHYDRQEEQRMKANYFFKTIDNKSIKIIVPTLVGGPVPEFSLMTSYQWSGKHRSFYKPILAGLYPDSYILYPWDKSMNYWGNDLKITGEKPVYIYFGDISYRETMKDELAKYLPENSAMDQVFYNDETKEVIYKLNLKPEQQ